MNKTIRRILEANKAKLKQAYKNGYNLAVYDRDSAGSLKMASMALSIISSSFRKTYNLYECLLFNTKIISIAWSVAE